MSDEAIKRAQGAALRAMRAKTGITQSEAARRAGTSQGLLSQWEAGKTTPLVSNVYALASVYETEASDLMASSLDIERARTLLAREEE